MILGTGLDVIEIARIEDSHRRFGDRFLQRILLPEEIAYCLGFSRPAPHIAARFAAKEAISKAFGTGIGLELGWHDLEVAREDSGKPIVRLHGAGPALFARRHAVALHLSLTHTATVAAATAILEGR
jgi:holo-[acyl-carrier protein] synthase